MPLPQGTARLDGDVMLYSADGDQRGVKVKVTVKNGQVEIEVPGLQIWSLVTFTAK